MADKIIIEVDLVKGDVKGALSQVEKELAKVGTVAGDKMAGNFKSSLSSIGTLLKNNIALAASAAAAYVTSKAVSAAVVQEEAVNRLNTALKISGDFSDKASSDLQNYASQLQATTRYGDEAIISQMALAKSLGATNEQAKLIASVAVNVADAFDMSLDSAFLNLSKTLGGTTGQLGKLIPELRLLSQEQLMAGKGIELLGEQYGNTAAERVKSFKGATDQLNNALGDTLESFGNLIIKNELIISGIHLTTKGFAALATTIGTAASMINNLFKSDSTKPLDVMNASISETRGQLNSLIDAKKRLEGGIFGVVFEADRIKAQQLGGDIEVLRKKILSQIQDRAKLIDAARAEKDQEAQIRKDKDAQILAEKLKSDTAYMSLVQNTSAMILQAESDKYAKLNELKANAIIGEQTFEQAKLQIRLQTDAQLKALEDQRLQEAEISLENLRAAFINNNKGIKFSSVELAKILQGTFAQGFGNAFQQIGVALQKGKNAMTAFTQAIGQMFASLASQAGDFYIAKGLALLADPMTSASGGQMIAAGAGLKVLAGILGGASGGGGSSSGGGGGASGGGTSAQSLTSTGVFEQQDIERQKPSTNVQIVVEGSLIQQEELGKFITSTLTEVSDKQGININKAFA